MRHGFSRRFPEARLDKNRHQIQEPGEPPSYRTTAPELRLWDQSIMGCPAYLSW